MKILNLYAGIGGNRALWTDCSVTAVENDTAIAEVYQKLYSDTVIVGDAHQYLLDHHREFDFIWSSPPCSSHGQRQVLRNCVDADLGLHVFMASQAPSLQLAA